MKKNLLLALALAAPAMAGVSAPLAVAPNPENMPAPAPVVSPWSMEIGAVYRWANDSIGSSYTVFTQRQQEMTTDPGDVDVWGVDLTAIYKINDNHSVNVRFGYNYGDNTEKLIIDYGQIGQEVYTSDVEVESFYIMPGYRYTGSITDSVSWYIGANAGISNMNVKSDFSAVAMGDPTGEGKLSASKWGFAASAEIGLQYHICDSVYLYGAYQYWMGTARPSDKGVKSKAQDYHSVTAGVGINF